MLIEQKQGKRYTEEELKILNSPEYLYTCKRCNVEKPNSSFYKQNVKRKGGRKYSAFCKACRTDEKTKEYASSDKRRKYLVKYTFGLEYSEYLNLYKKQQSCCAICGVHEDTLSIRLSVDHCHETKKVRGLLCRNCNTALGSLKDSVFLLEKAINYLKENNSR